MTIRFLILGMLIWIIFYPINMKVSPSGQGSSLPVVPVREKSKHCGCKSHPYHSATLTGWTKSINNQQQPSESILLTSLPNGFNNTTKNSHHPMGYPWEKPPPKIPKRRTRDKIAHNLRYKILDPHLHRFINSVVLNNHTRNVNNLLLNTTSVAKISSQTHTTPSQNKQVTIGCIQLTNVSRRETLKRENRLGYEKQKNSAKIRLNSHLYHTQNRKRAVGENTSNNIITNKDDTRPLLNAHTVSQSQLSKHVNAQENNTDLTRTRHQHIHREILHKANIGCIKLIYGSRRETRKRETRLWYEKQKNSAKIRQNSHYHTQIRKRIVGGNTANNTNKDDARPLLNAHTVSQSQLSKNVNTQENNTNLTQTRHQDTHGETLPSNSIYWTLSLYTRGEMNSATRPNCLHKNPNASKHWRCTISTGDMRGPSTGNNNEISNKQLHTHSTVAPFLQLIRNRKNLYPDTWTHRSNHGYLIHCTHSTKIMNETNEISKSRLTHSLKSTKSMGKHHRSDSRTCPHREKVRGKWSDLIGQISETSKIDETDKYHDQSKHTPHQVTHQPFVNMSAATKSFSSSLWVSLSSPDSSLYNSLAGVNALIQFSAFDSFDNVVNVGTQFTWSLVGPARYSGSSSSTTGSATGLKDIKYVAYIAGRYTLQVSIGVVPVKLPVSPLYIVVNADSNAASATKSRAFGNGLNHAISEEWANFVVNVADPYGNPIENAGDFAVAGLFDSPGPRDAISTGLLHKLNFQTPSPHNPLPSDSYPHNNATKLHTLFLLVGNTPVGTIEVHIQIKLLDSDHNLVHLLTDGKLPEQDSLIVTKPFQEAHLPPLLDNSCCTVFQTALVDGLLRVVPDTTPLMAILGCLTITLLLLARSRNSSPHLGLATPESMPTEDSEYETVEGNSEYETEEEGYESEYETVNLGLPDCPVPEYATHPGDYDYIPEGEFLLFRQNPQLLIDTIAHAVVP